MVFARNMVEVKNEMKAQGYRKADRGVAGRAISRSRKPPTISTRTASWLTAYSTEIPVAVLGAKYKWAPRWRACFKKTWTKRNFRNAVRFSGRAILLFRLIAASLFRVRHLAFAQSTTATGCRQWREDRWRSLAGPVGEIVGGTGRCSLSARAWKSPMQ